VPGRFDARSSPPQPWSHARIAAFRSLVADAPIGVTVRGACMEPALLPNVPVRISRARYYWPGDIVAVVTPDRGVLLHRLLGYRWHGGRLCGVTAGDHCVRIDGPAPLAHFVGRLVGYRPTWRARFRALASLVRMAVARLAR
jgi:hypothetical protein